MSLVTNRAKGGLLDINDGANQQLLISKHPHAEPASEVVLLTGDLPADLDITTVFGSLNASVIKKCAQETEGAPGPSQAEDRLWRKMVSYFKDTSADLCKAVAASARRFATEYVDPKSVEALLNNRGVALD